MLQTFSMEEYFWTLFVVQIWVRPKVHNHLRTIQIKSYWSGHLCNFNSNLSIIKCELQGISPVCDRFLDFFSWVSHVWADLAFFFFPPHCLFLTFSISILCFAFTPFSGFLLPFDICFFRVRLMVFLLLLAVFSCLESIFWFLPFLCASFLVLLLVFWSFFLFPSLFVHVWLVGFLFVFLLNLCLAFFGQLWPLRH